MSISCPMKYSLQNTVLRIEATYRGCISVPFSMGNPFDTPYGFRAWRATDSIFSRQSSRLQEMIMSIELPKHRTYAHKIQLAS